MTSAVLLQGHTKIMLVNEKTDVGDSQDNNKGPTKAESAATSCRLFLRHVADKRKIILQFVFFLHCLSEVQTQ